MPRIQPKCLLCRQFIPYQKLKDDANPPKDRKGRTCGWCEKKVQYKSEDGICKHFDP